MCRVWGVERAPLNAEVIIIVVPNVVIMISPSPSAWAWPHSPTAHPEPLLQPLPANCPSIHPPTPPQRLPAALALSTCNLRANGGQGRDMGVRPSRDPLGHLLPLCLLHSASSLLPRCLPSSPTHTSPPQLPCLAPHLLQVPPLSLTQLSVAAARPTAWTGDGSLTSSLRLGPCGGWWCWETWLLANTPGWE